MAKALDMAVLAWGVLEEGEHTGKYNSPGEEPKRNSAASPKNLELVKTLMAVAKESGRTPAQVAINWVRGHSGSAPVIRIIAARNEAQIRDNLAAVDFGLTPEQAQKLDDASPIDRGFPNSFLASEHVRGLIFGRTYAAIDNHHRQQS